MILSIRKIAIAVFILTIMQSCSYYDKNYQEKVADPDILHESMKQLTDVLIHDIFSPPVASRNYAYPSIAAYEVARHMDKSYLSFEGNLSELVDIPKPDSTLVYSFPIAAQEAFLVTARRFVFSEDSINVRIDEVHKIWEEIGIPKDVYTRSIDYGNTVAQHIIDWSQGDNYNETRSYPKYTVTEDDYTWKPTPPGYGEGIEPHWRDIRTFVIDSAQQFRPDFPTNYDLRKGSKFYEETMEVYNAVKNASREEEEIANFWDCNPYKLNIIGHVMHATKKITPGGHWIGIAKIAAQKDNADLVKSSYTYAMTSIGLADAFISCWDEKYRSRYIRPETVINEYIDEAWTPILQTPPFPEYTSGHSVISSAAAVILTDIYGDNFEFADDTELEFGLPIRTFKSFKEASAEAAVSRLYGGIHYRPAIDNGVVQGTKLGEFLIEELELRS